MGQSAAELRADIARRRDDMSSTLDALGERVSPRHLVRRRTRRVTAYFERARDAVMGTAHDAAGMARSATGSPTDATSGLASSASHRLHEAGDTMRSTPAAAVRQTRGNPIAAGLVAFGVGLLVGSMPPPTDPEERMALAVEDRAQPVLNEAREVVSDVAGHVKESAREAAGELRESTREATDEVGQQARSEGRRVADAARPPKR